MTVRYPLRQYSHGDGAYREFKDGLGTFRILVGGIRNFGQKQGKPTPYLLGKSVTTADHLDAEMEYIANPMFRCR